MKKSRSVSSKIALFGASVTMVSAGLLGTAMAANGDGYALDTSGKIVRNTDGACLRTGAWTPALAVPECEAGKAPVLVMSKAPESTPAEPTKAPVVPMIAGYATDASGKIARNVDGTCWRTASWTPSLALAECEGGAATVAAAAPAAAPAKAAAPVAAAKAAETSGPITLSSDGLFDFGKSTLRKGGDASLAPIAAKLKSVTGTIAINGHTDRIGNAKSNMALSKARAESIKKYLVGAGLKASQITTQGMGSSTPVTKADQCTGKQSPAVIACLQPDRRVTIQAQ